MMDVHGWQRPDSTDKTGCDQRTAVFQSDRL